MAESLAAQAGALAEKPFEMPAVFDPQGAAPMVSKKWAPYITFAHPNRADEWKKLTAKFKDVTASEMYFIDGDDIRDLSVAKLGWIVGTQYWAHKSPKGELLQVWFDEQPNRKEYVEAVVLVYLDDKVVPANVTFKSTKCPAAITLSKALAACQKPEWSEESEAHAASLVVNQPFGRFYGDVVLLPSRPSKKSGLPYRPTSCTIHPTTSTEWAMLKQLSEDPGCQKMMTAAAERYNSQMAELKSKVAK